LRKFQRFCDVDLQLSRRTVKDHRSRIKRFLSALKKDASEISREDSREYLSHFKQGRAPATYSGMLKSLRVFFQDFVGKPNVIVSFRFPTIPFKPKVVPSKKELCQLYDALDSELSRALFLFYASSGRRKTEVLSLSRKNIDFDKRIIVPNCHNRSTKNSYVSFYNREAEEALSKIDKNEEKLFQINDRQHNKI
jgi:site-specific recombinase XerD